MLNTFASFLADQIPHKFLKFITKKGEIIKSRTEIFIRKKIMIFKKGSF